MTIDYKIKIKSQELRGNIKFDYLKYIELSLIGGIY